MKFSSSRTGVLTEWQINSKSSLKVCSSFLLVWPSVSSKLTSVKSIPIVLGVNLSKNLYAKSREIPLPSAVPVDWNCYPSTPSMSKEIQYLLSLVWLKYCLILPWILSKSSILQFSGSKMRTPFSLTRASSSSSKDLMPK